jgi:predicted outer membrane repeat protein
VATFIVTTLVDENDTGATVGVPGGTGLSLREAIALANSEAGADTITFDAGLAGTIRLDGGDGVGGAAGGTLSITEAVTIDGDGRILITGDVANDDTKVTGDITDIFATAGTELVDNVRIFSATANLTLEGLTLTGGVAGSGQSGGAVNSDATVTLTNSTVTGNSAGLHGGGISADTATLTNSTVSGNSAAFGGGGLWNITTTLTNSTVSGNSAGEHGGGINTDIATLTNSTVSGNSAGLGGGGLFALTATLTDSTVSGNSAGEHGGGINSFTAELTNSTVSDNSAGFGGGGIFTLSTTTLTNSTVAGNSAALDGGGINADTATLTNSTVSGNSAGDEGGGIFALTTTDLTNSIVLGNAAAVADDEVHGTVNLTGGNILGTNVFQGSSDIGDTTAQQVFAATVDIGGGVLAGVLANNGGPVQTIALNASATNPALDASSPTALTADARGTAYVDQTGVADGNGAIADLGAFELASVINVAPALGTGTLAAVLEDTASPGGQTVATIFSGQFADANVGDTLAGIVVVGNTANLATQGAWQYSTDGGTSWFGIGAVNDVTLGLVLDDTTRIRFVPVANFNGVPTALSVRALDSSYGGGLTSGATRVTLDTSAPGGSTPIATSTTALSTSITPVNDAPSAVVLSNVHGPIAENASTKLAIKIADIAVTDIDGGTNVLSLAGADAALFEIVGTQLRLKAGAKLDFETNPTLDVTVRVDDPGVGGPIDAFRSLSIKVTDALEVINGNNNANKLVGGNSAEIISGLGGNDRIIGNGGNDRIIGGRGVDTMTGGTGRDVFVFSSIQDSAPGQSGLIGNGVLGVAAGRGLRDIITDFIHGQDKIDLSAIDANTKLAGNQAFTWIGTKGFTHKPGQLMEKLYDFAGTSQDRTIIYGDINGDARADFQIELVGLKHLTSGDFVL